MQLYGRLSCRLIFQSTSINSMYTGKIKTENISIVGFIWIHLSKFINIFIWNTQYFFLRMLLNLNRITLNLHCRLSNKTRLNVQYPTLSVCICANIVLNIEKKCVLDLFYRYMYYWIYTQAIILISIKYSENQLRFIIMYWKNVFLNISSML